MNKEELKNYIYDPMPDETPKAFDAFCTYRNMGKKRSFEKVSKELSKSIALLSRWASKNDWAERVVLYDLAQEKINREMFEDINRDAHLEKLEKYRRENEELGKAWRATGATLLARIKKKIDNIKDNEITTKDLPGLTKSAEICTNLGDRLLAESLAVEKLLQQRLDENL